MIGFTKLDHIKVGDILSINGAWYTVHQHVKTQLGVTTFSTLYITLKKNPVWFWFWKDYLLKPANVKEVTFSKNHGRKLVYNVDIAE